MWQASYVCIANAMLELTTCKRMKQICATLLLYLRIQVRSWGSFGSALQRTISGAP